MDKEKLESAIFALRLQEDILGIETVDLAIQVLEEQFNAQFLKEKDENQRKQVTILFADICGFTNLSSKLDVEDLHLLVTGLWQLIDKIIVGFGGRIDKYMGDGFLAVFGLQTSREDDPIRAIHAAVEIQRQLNRYKSDFATWPIKLSKDIEPIQMRIGAHIGEVYLGEEGVEGSRSVFGPTVNLANFIEGIAPHGGILVSAALAAHVHGVFEVHKYRLSRTKIVNDFVQTWQVIGERQLGKNILLRSGRNPDSSLMGRGDTLNWVKDGYYKTLTDKKLHIMMLFGEAGIGKTRLVKEFIDWLDLLPDSVTLIVGHGAQHLQNRPFAMMKNSLCSLAGITSLDDSSAIANKLTKLLDQLSGVDDVNIRNGHLLAQTIGFNNLHNPFVQDAIYENTEISQLISAILIDIVRKSFKTQKAILFIFDDCQWADKEFIHAIGNQLQHVLDLPIYILLVGRSSFSSRYDTWRRNWDTLGITSQSKSLEPLSRIQANNLIKELLPENSTPPQNVLDYISAASSGNPYFIEEFVKVLIETGKLDGNIKSWPVVEKDAYRLPIPTTLTGVLQARIEQLPAETKRVLFHAASIGYTFWDGLLAQMQEDKRTKKSVIDITAILDDLIVQGFILQAESSRFVGHNEYYFRHQALCDVAYNAILRKHKTIYHKIIAKWYATYCLESDSDSASYIGDHYLASGDVSLAIKWFINAANLCIDAQNFAAAINLYERVIENLPTTREIDRLTHSVSLGELYERVGKYDKAISLFEEVVNNSVNDDIKAKTLIKLCSLNLAERNFQAVLTYAEETIEIATYEFNACELIEGNYYRGEAFRNLGNLLASVESAKQALTLCLNGLHPCLQCVKILGLLSAVSVQLGNFEEAAAYIDLFDQETTAIFAGQRTSKEIGLSLLAIGRYKFQMGHYQEAIELLQRSSEIFTDLKESHSAEFALNSLIEAICAQGDYAKALKTAQHQNTDATRLGLMHLHNGNFSKGQAIFEQLLEASTAQELIANPQIYYMLSGAKICLGNYFEAQIDAKQAIKLAQKLRLVAVEAFGWLMLGVASYRQKTTIIDDGKFISSASCFDRALALAEKINQNEQLGVSLLAAVLYVSGSHMIVSGDVEQGRLNVDKARALFKKWSPKAEESKLMQAILPNATE